MRLWTFLFILSTYMLTSCYHKKQTPAPEPICPAPPVCEKFETTKRLCSEIIAGQNDQLKYAILKIKKLENDISELETSIQTCHSENTPSSIYSEPVEPSEPEYL